MNSKTNSLLMPLNRRRFLAAGGGGMALAAMGPLYSFAAETVRFGIFGNAEKLAIRGKAIARYAELNPQVKVVYEGVPSDSWPDKIAAMVAGGNARVGVDRTGAIALRTPSHAATPRCCSTPRPSRHPSASPHSARRRSCS